MGGLPGEFSKIFESRVGLLGAVWDHYTSPMGVQYVYVHVYTNVNLYSVVTSVAKHFAGAPSKCSGSPMICLRPVRCLIAL